MSATNATTNYNFPLFIGTDKPAWLVDWNSAMSAIDAAIKGVDTDVQGAIVDISGLSSTVAAHTSSISTITGQITVITTNLNTATGNINTINSLIGNGAPTTTDQTIIGAINELHANQGDLADLTTPAVSLVAAINAITGGAVAASAVSYDNTTSGLTATNVQAAIDEIVQEMPNGDIILTGTLGALNTGVVLSADYHPDQYYAAGAIFYNSTTTQWVSESGVASVEIVINETNGVRAFARDASATNQQVKAIIRKYA